MYQLGSKLTVGPGRIDVPWSYLGWWGGSLGVFTLGLLIKSAHLPERATRATWNDLFVTSHQLWHCCINGAFVMGTFIGWDVYLRWRPDCPAEPEPV